MTKNNHKSIVEPSKFVQYALHDRISLLKDYNTALFCFDPGIYRKLKKMFKGRSFSGLTGELYLMDNKIAIAGIFGIGCPTTIAFIEELAACGIKRFVGLGSAGALHNDISVGDVVLCTGAFSDEGTSAHYPGYKSFSKPTYTLSTRIALWFKKHQIPFVKAKTWTIDAPYRETEQQLEYFLNLGADVVEMEASAMFNVGKFRKLDIASVFIVGDSIAGGRWSPGFISKDIEKKSLSVAREIVAFLSDPEAAELK